MFSGSSGSKGNGKSKSKGKRAAASDKGTLVAEARKAREERAAKASTKALDEKKAASGTVLKILQLPTSTTPTPKASSTSTVASVASVSSSRSAIGKTLNGLDGGLGSASITDAIGGQGGGEGASDSAAAPTPAAAAAAAASSSTGPPLTSATGATSGQLSGMVLFSAAEKLLLLVKLVGQPTAADDRRTVHLFRAILAGMTHDASNDPALSFAAMSLV
eukprot:gene20106-9310_t